MAAKQHRLDRIEAVLASLEPDLSDERVKKVLHERHHLRTFFWLARGGDERGEPFANPSEDMTLEEVLPISVDGLVVAGSTTMVVRRRHGRGGGWLAWLAVSLGIGASLAANVVAADPTLVDTDVVRGVIAGWPPVASAELAIQLRSRGSHRSETGTGPWQ